MVTKYRTNYNETYPISDTGAKFRFVANTELTWTVPGDSTKHYRAQFTYPSDASVWVKLNATVTFPLAGTVVDAANEMLNPKNLYVVGGDVIHAISTGTPQMGVQLLLVYDN